MWGIEVNQGDGMRWHERFSVAGNDQFATVPPSSLPEVPERVKTMRGRDDEEVKEKLRLGRCPGMRPHTKTSYGG